MIDQAHLEHIVGNAGQLALTSWPGHGKTVESWEKAPGQPVCTADLAVDAFLKTELSGLLPAAGWLSEETADSHERLDRDLIWLVDPIDGTRDFVAGRPGWAVSVALVSAGKPLMGILSAPARNEMWCAVAGQGAWRNGVPLAASSRSIFSGSRVPADRLRSPDDGLTIVDKPNSIALRAAMVAADEADFVAALRWGFEWDLGAAALIAREAGATVSDALGEPLAFNKRDPRALGLLVSAPAIHAAAVRFVAPYLP
ncbi:MAG: 3'(2'),5'-bisphosphate nucleotidase CysQ [Novosphingobium sp.]|nr:3'(2'),5'-bisphosphate nucleotidase CysQ [Novosphingobium sp.]